jgi:D-cysteine desulfhydrase
MNPPPKLDLARLPTPLQPLDRLSEALGGPRIWVKRDDLTEAAGAGNKIRKLEFVLADALNQGATALITSGGLQSNHCRATALFAAQLGLQCHLILRGSEARTANGNLLLNQLLGANIDYVSDQAFERLDALYARKAAQLSASGERPYQIPIGASDELGLWGYIQAVKELAADFASARIQPSCIVTAVGSGGTYAGLLLGQALYNLTLPVTGICVSRNAAFFERKAAMDTARWQKRFQSSLNPELGLLRDDFIGDGYGLASPEVYRLIAWLAQLEGIILDPVYTGKAFQGLVQMIQQGDIEGTDVVFLHTGGLLGLFPQMSQQILSELLE